MPKRDTSRGKYSEQRTKQKMRGDLDPKPKPKPKSRSGMKSELRTGTRSETKSGREQRESFQQAPRFDQALAAAEVVDASDHCGQLTNEMIVLVYEKIEKIKQDLHTQAERKRELELELGRQREEVKATQELSRKLEKDQAKIVQDCEALENDVERYQGDVSVLTEALAKAEQERLVMIDTLQAEIAIRKERLEKEKVELVEEREAQMEIENTVAEQKDALESQDSTLEQEIRYLQAAIKQMRVKEDQRIKKFKNDSKTLDIALKLSAELNDSSHPHS